MFDRFTEGARRAVVAARDEAHRLGHRLIGPQHLLLGLIDEHDGVGGRALRSLGLSGDAIRERVAASEAPRDEPAPAQPAFDADAKRLLALSLREALQLGDTSIDTGDLALAIADQRHSAATRILAEMGVEPKALRARVLELRGDQTARRLPARRSATTPTGDVVSFELSPAAQEMLSRSARHALRLGFDVASHGPLPLRLLGGAGSAVLRSTGNAGQTPGPVTTPGLTPAACSFCGATSPGCGALLRGATGALICSRCAESAASGGSDAASDG